MKLIDQYKNIKYEDLTEWEIKMFQSLWIFNWFGGGWQNTIIKFLIWLICRKFDIAIANKHDYGFYLGWSIARFYECNEKFYHAMVKDSIAVPWIMKFYYLLVAFLAYCSIELLWKKYFNFR